MLAKDMVDIGAIVKTPYQTRMQRVLAYMRQNYQNPLNLDDLAEVAALSRFHFHRVFGAMIGQTPAEALRDIRMTQAAVLLISTDLPIAAIAEKVGFPVLGSFTRSFRQTFQTSASKMRSSGQLPPMPTPPRTGDLPMHDVTIKTMPDMRVAALEHIGPYPNIGGTFGQLSGVFAAANLFGAVIGPAIGIYYDSPDSKPAAQLRAHAGLIVNNSAVLPSGVQELFILGGRYAVLRLVGPYSGLPAAWAWFYGQWLAESGEELADAAPFELNLNSPMDTAPQDLVTEVCVKLV
jgi:AraC family transcriptional regulator